MPETLHKAPIAIVDEDRFAPVGTHRGGLLPAALHAAGMINQRGGPGAWMPGDYTFVLDIPPNFQRDVLAGRSPSIQLNVDATRMSQAFVGSGYVQQIVMGEVNEFVQHYRGAPVPPVELVLRARFNPNLEQSWFGSLMEIINNITMLSIILTGAALIREREHGTIEHLLVMPVTPTEIMLAKVWSMGLVVLLAAAPVAVFVVQGIAARADRRLVPLFLAVPRLHLFATTSMGIFMAPWRVHAAVRLLLMLDAAPAADALGRHHAAREHAGAGAVLFTLSRALAPLGRPP
jgi:ABC-2 type transport system permease protein